MSNAYQILLFSFGERRFRVTKKTRLHAKLLSCRLPQSHKEGTEIGGRAWPHPIKELVQNIGGLIKTRGNDSTCLSQSGCARVMKTDA